MPVYFSEINRDPRYFLTPVGAAMPNLHIAEELNLGSSECTFRIAGGVPGKKVCWEVKALRNDIYVRTYGAPVEIEKPETERGTYQQPELYGEPVLPLDSSSAQETATSVGADSQEPAAAIQQ